MGVTRELSQALALFLADPERGGKFSALPEKSSVQRVLGRGAFSFKARSRMPSMSERSMDLIIQSKMGTICGGIICLRRSQASL